VRILQQPNSISHAANRDDGRQVQSMFHRAFNKTVGQYVFWHPIALKEAFLTVEVIIQPSSSGRSFLFISVEPCLERPAQARPLNLLLWMGPSFYGFRMN